MPTIHVPQSVADKIDEKLVQLITEGQFKFRRSTVIELALLHGIDKVTVAQALMHESFPIDPNLLARAQELTKGMNVDLNKPL